MTKQIFFFLTVLIVVATSCTDPSSKQAVRFLSMNMAGKKTLDTLSVQENAVFYRAVQAYRCEHHDAIGTTGLYDVWDSLSTLGRPLASHPSYCPDEEMLPDTCLLPYVDSAVFRWRRSPWHHRIPFDVFCRHVVPYRVYESWWMGATDVFRKRFSSLLEGVTDPVVAAGILRDTLSRWFHQDPTFFRDRPGLRPTSFQNVVMAGTGICYDYNAALVTALRSFSIPAAINTVPWWGNSNASHFWTEQIGAPPKGIYDNSQMDFHVIEDERIDDSFWFKGGVIQDSTGIPEDVQWRKNRTVPKVFRLNYERQRTSLAVRAREEIPPVFRNPCMEDITSDRVRTADVRLNLSRASKRRRFAYLCCYRPDNYSWTPVAWARAHGKRATFRDVGVRILYLAAWYIDGFLVPCSDPFVLEADGSLRFLRPDDAERHAAAFRSKVPFRTNVAYYAMTMCGDRIEVASAPDFSDAKLVGSIDSIPYYRMDVHLPAEVPSSRYVIYRLGEGSLKFLSELEVYVENEKGQTELIHGRPIGNPGLSIGPVSYAFDGNRETFLFFDRSEGKKDYVALDLGKRYRIKRIRLIPRSDDNAIITGEEYELFYWKNGAWVSLGRRSGGDDGMLHYGAVPSRALFRIHNHTRGNENRPFTFEKGRQVWW